MRLLVVTGDYPPPTTGGYAAMAADVCERLAGRHHDVTVLRPGDEPERLVAGVHVRTELGSYWNGYENTSPSFDEALAIERRNHAAFARAVEETKPDVISFWHMGATSLGLISAAAALATPIAFVIGDDWLVYGRWADAWVRRFHDDDGEAEQVARDTGLPTRLPALETLGPFCFVSDHTRRRAAQAGVNPQRWCLAPPGVDREHFAVGVEQPWRGALLWAGRVTRDKGIFTAVDALGLLPNMSLRIAGPVDPRIGADLTTAIAQAGVADRVRFDLLERKEIVSAYQTADVTLFTSEMESEGFGLVPLESMACGTPVVATGAGGSAEYCLDGENCLLYPAGDHKALAATVTRLAGDEHLRLSLSIGGVRTATLLSADTQAWIIERALYAALDGATG